MSWATEKAEITGVLTGYTEVPELREHDQSSIVHKKNCFVLKIGGGRFDELTSNALNGVHKVRLELSYVNNTNANRDTNYATFEGVLTSLAALTNFKGLIDDETTFEDKTEKVTVGTINFYYGNPQLG